MEGLESTWALTSALMRLTGGEGGEGSWGLLGLDGRRPRRPFKLSVRTTAWRRKRTWSTHAVSGSICANICFYARFGNLFRGDLDVPSLTMPTTRHFWKRQNWQRFLRRLSTGQFLFAKHTYLAFFWTVRWRKERKRKGKMLPNRNRLK